MGDLAEILVTNTFPNVAEMNALANMCNATYGLSIPTFASQILLVGDSITAGAGASYAGGSWASLMGANCPSKHYVNKGRSGAFTSDLLGDASANLYPFTSCGVPTTCVVWSGTNDVDFGGFTGAQAYANIVSLCQGLRANGATRIVVVTMLPRDGDETKRQALNNLLRANWASFADALADVETLAMGGAGANDSLLYFVADKVHPNDTGHAILFDLIAPLVDGTVTPPPAGPIGLILTPSSGNIVLSWTASGGATGYDVQSSSSNTIGAVWTTISSNQAGTTFTDTGAAATATAGTTGEAYYRVRARVFGTPSLWTTNGGASVYPVFDAFVDANGKLLTAHTMNAGAGWNLGEHDQPAVIEGNNATFANSTFFSNNIAWTDTGLPDATVSMTGFLSNNGGHGYNLFLVFRYVDDNNYWYVNLAGSANGLPGMSINEIVGGVTTQRAYSNFNPTDGVFHTLQVVFGGPSIIATVDGGTSLTYGSAATGLTATKHGFWQNTPNDAASQSDLITNARARVNLPTANTTTNGPDDVAINTLITACSRQIEKYCRRTFASTAYDELYSGTAGRILMLRNFPIVSVQKRAVPADFNITNS